MNAKTHPLRRLIVIGAFFVFGGALHAQTTGFNQTGAGPFDYNNTANWVGSTINGVWDSSLTITATQTATFGADTVLTTGFNFGYTGNFDLTLRSAGTANRTVTLGGDIVVNPASNRTITLGSTTANQGLNVDLGGTNRTVTMSASKTLAFLNNVTNGSLTISGSSPTAGGGTVRFSSAGNAASSQLIVTQNATLQFGFSTSNAGATRAQQVTLQSGGKLSVVGNSASNTVESISGNLVINGAAPLAQSISGSMPSITLTPNSTRNVRLSIGELQRSNFGTVLIRGVSVGANTIASATINSTNLEITGTAPALIGGGGSAGSTNISIIPWAVGGTTTSDTGSTLLTYTAANGIRTLDTATEFASAFGSATDNVRLTANATVSSPTTANSLLIGAPSVVVSGTSPITVTSGAVFFTGTSSSISAPLNFGSAEGVIGMARVATVSGNISGSGGLTLHGTRTDELLTLSGTGSTYTGDTHILGAAIISNGVLPSGTRTGDVHVSGTFRLPTAGGTVTINGLNGAGSVIYGNSNAATLVVGDNNATSTFTGTISSSTNQLALTKVGTGTLTFTAANSYNRPTTVSAGTLQINNTSGSGTGSGTVTVNTGATLAGDGSITTAANNFVYVNGTFQVGQTGATSGQDFSLTTSGSGSTVFGAVSSLDFDLWSTSGTDMSSNLAAADMLRLFGTLDITSGAILKLGNPNSLSFQNGDTFRLFDWTGIGTRTGTFAIDSTALALSGSLSLDTTNLYTLGTISILGVPEPSRALLLMVGLAVTVSRRRRTLHASPVE
ncbi:MAG: autotransporter-associated beta strand repeat-containing protein [Verrucomicrobiaceae bacterium]|nr:autotransporter-associated beta strand repeat-containing protein [Verrucomicrobiaceae bacterium]